MRIPLDKFKEELKKQNLTHDQYFNILYAAIDLIGASKIEGMNEIQKIYTKK